MEAIKESSHSVSFSIIKKGHKVFLEEIEELSCNYDDDKDYINCFEDNEIKSIKKTQIKEDLVIPLLESPWLNSSRKVFESTEVSKEKFYNISSNSGNVSIEELAAKELMEESKLSHTSKVVVDNTINSPLHHIAYSEEATLQDYENVPIEQFGIALLRGMGWKPGEGIGRSKKQVVKPVDVQVRPKNLGLGANPKISIKSKDKDVNASTVLQIGSPVCINHGSYKDLYGIVQGFDENSGRVIVKLAISEAIINICELNVHMVSLKEYNEFSSVINKKCISIKNPEKKATEFDERQVCILNSESKTKIDRKLREQSVKTWIRPHLKVRMIDEKYRNGQFYKYKMTVLDVLSPNVCLCQTHDAQLLDDISSYMLEMVVPKTRSVVMILGGEHKGKLGRIIGKDKIRSTASIQLLQDFQKIINLNFNIICEYVGDINTID